MSKGDAVDEPSMDEILSSIRKIIAEDEVEEPRPQPKASRPSPVRASEPGHGADDEDVFADEVDVLELTADDMTEEEDAVLLQPTDEGADRFEVDEDVRTPDSNPFAGEPEHATSGGAVMLDHLTEVLLDSGAASAASGALQRLSAAVAPGEAVAGGNRSIETFLADLVRPELKTWLDTNLAPLVERIVEREIKKLVRDAQPE